MRQENELGDSSELSDQDGLKNSEVEHFLLDEARTYVEGRAGETFESFTERLGPEVHESILDSLKLGQTIARSLSELTENLGGLGETGAKLRAGLADFESVLSKGEQWVEANPTAIEAGVKLLVLAAIAYKSPDLATKLVEEAPDRLLAPLAALASAVHA